MNKAGRGTAPGAAGATMIIVAAVVLGHGLCRRQRVAVLGGGRIVQQGDGAALRSAPATDFVRELFDEGRGA